MLQTFDKIIESTKHFYEIVQILHLIKRGEFVNNNPMYQQCKKLKHKKHANSCRQSTQSTTIKHQEEIQHMPSSTRTCVNLHTRQQACRNPRMLESRIPAWCDICRQFLSYLQKNHVYFQTILSYEQNFMKNEI